MRRLILLPLVLSCLTLASAAHAHDDDDYDDDDHGSSNNAPKYKQKSEPGIALDVSRFGPQAFSGAAMTGLSLAFHGRVGRRVAIDLGLEQAYGTSSGYRRYDIGWTLPKLFVYLNPKSKTQIFTSLAFDMRVSHFESGDKEVPDAVPWGHFYLGTAAGLGVEHRMDKATALRLEVRGYLRGRTQGQGDALAKVAPTFAQDVKGDRGVAVSLGMVFF